jgi:glyoxylase-like metal-dependent hydrolase (beta-lactamase superfamily II)
MLEDTFSDIIGKARFGLDIPQADLARRAGLPVSRVQALLQGEAAPVREEIERLAPILRLSAWKLTQIALAGWEPAAVRRVEGADRLHPRLHPIEGLIGDYPVNGYLLIATAGGILFDTGVRPDAVCAILKREGATLSAICITHAHADHIGGVEAIHAATGAPIYLHANERTHPKGTIPLHSEEEIVVGPFRVRSLMTPGHTPGGVSFFVAGTPPMAFVGDALFAGSLGRADSPASYPTLLTSVRERILTLPGETLLFPGHGPATTVAEERRHNPFFRDEGPASFLIAKKGLC